MTLLVPLKNQPCYFLYVETVYDNYYDFCKLIKVWSEIQQLPNEHLDIKIDFHYCTFLGHNGVAFLGGLIRLIQSRGGRVTFDLEFTTNICERKSWTSHY